MGSFREGGGRERLSARRFILLRWAIGGLSVNTGDLGTGSQKPLGA